MRFAAWALTAMCAFGFILSAFERGWAVISETQWLAAVTGWFVVALHEERNK